MLGKELRVVEAVRDWGFEKHDKESQEFFA